MYIYELFIILHTLKLAKKKYTLKTYLKDLSVYFCGGADGSRTRVQTVIDITFYMLSATI